MERGLDSVAFPKPSGDVNYKFREFLRNRPCDFCKAGAWSTTDGKWHNDVFHIRARGMGGKGQKCKDVGNCVTSCRNCHIEFGHIGQAEFELRHNVNMKAIAEEIHRQWSA